MWAAEFAWGGFTALLVFSIFLLAEWPYYTKSHFENCSFLENEFRLRDKASASILEWDVGTPQNFYHPHFSVVVSAKCSELSHHLRLIGSGSFNLKKSAKKSEDVCVSFSVCGVKWLFRQRRVNSRPFKVNVIYTSFVLLTKSACNDPKSVVRR